MERPEVFRPSAAGTVLMAGALPLFALGLIVGGVAALSSGEGLGILLFVLFVAGGILIGAFAAVMLRGWFTIEVNESALCLVGLFGRRFQLPWIDLDAVGLVRWRGARVLAVRPTEPWSKTPSPFVLRWDAAHRLLLISGVERWSRPTDELVGAVREHAAAKWHDQLAEPISD